MAKHLTLEERDRIAQLRYQEADQKEIAQALRRSPATISRELRRNGTGGDYYAAQAQRESQRRRRERPLVRKMEDPQINQQVRSGLTHEWSPEQISGRMKQQRPDDDKRTVSPQTIYAWIKKDEHREHWESFLRRRGKRPYRRKEGDCRADRSPRYGADAPHPAAQAGVAPSGAGSDRSHRTRSSITGDEAPLTHSRL